MSSLNVALPEIARATRADETQLTWIVDAYSLVFAALLLPAGALSDRFGRRLTLMVGLSIFAAGSAVAMFADGASELIVLRAVLGLGAALVMPATLSTITGTFSAEHRTKAVAIWAGVAGASAVLGVLASGTLLEFWGWQSVFAFNVVLAVVALVGTLRVVPESADPAAPRLDLRGAVTAALGLVLLVYSIIEAPTHGWSSARTVTGLAAGVVVLVGFVVLEFRLRNPMLDPRVFGHRRLSAGALATFVQFFAFFGFIFLFLQYLQLVRGDSPLRSAVSILPMAAALMPVSRLVPFLVPRWGTRTVCVAGLLLLSGGFFIIAQVDASSSYWLVVAGLLPIGAGMGAATTPATTAITESLPASQQGVGSALNDLARELGGALGIAVIGSILASVYRSSFVAPDAGEGVASEVLARAKESVAIATHAGGPVGDAGRTAFVDGLHAGLTACSIAALVAAVAVGLLLPRDD
jgi:EmrB/QacA subfamily drug resistance transporter